jgi:hypothetical protein
MPKKAQNGKPADRVRVPSRAKPGLGRVPGGPSLSQKETQKERPPIPEQPSPSLESHVCWANYYRRRAIETWKRAARAIDPAVKAALERAASDQRAHARQAEPLMRNHVAIKTNRAAKKKAIG